MTEAIEFRVLFSTNVKELYEALLERIFIIIDRFAPKKAQRCPQVMPVAARKIVQLSKNTDIPVEKTPKLSKHRNKKKI